MNFHHYPRSHWSEYIADEAELNTILEELRSFGGVYEFKDYVPRQPGKPRWRSFLVAKNNPPLMHHVAGPAPLPQALGEDLP